MWVILGIAIGLVVVIIGWMFMVVIRATHQANQIAAPRGARQEWRPIDDEDGLGEVGLGCLFVLVGLAALGFASIAPHYVRQAYDKGLPAVIIAFATLAMDFAMRSLRKHVHGRESSPADYRERGQPLDVTLLLIGLVLAIGMFLLSVIPRLPSPWIPGLQGGIVAASLILLAYRLHRLRFYVLAAISAVVGLATSMATVADPMLGSALYFGITGGAIFVSGTLAFHAFRQQSRPRVGS